MNERWGWTEMLRAAWLLAWKDTVVRCQQRITIVFIVVLPLVLTMIMGVAFRGIGPRNATATIAILDEDHGETGQWVQRIARDKTVFPPASGADSEGESSPSPGGVSWEFLTDVSVEEARRRVAEGMLDAVIVLPKGLSKKLAANGKTTIEVVVGAGQTQKQANVKTMLDRLVQRGRRRDPSPLSFAVRETGEAKLVEGFDGFVQAVAGNGVMFILLNCMATGGLALVQEKRQNTMSRLLMSPLTPGTIILGKTIGVMIVGVAQAIVIFGFGVLVGVKLGSVLGVAMVTLMFICVGSALGLMIAAVARREETVQAVCAPIALVMTSLGGGMFPLDGAPEWIKRLSLVFPTGWAMDAYHKLMWDGRDWISVLPNVGVLAGFAVLFFILGIRSLRWD